MTAQQIRALGPALSHYLDEFADCFIHFETRDHLKQYVQGQLSNLPRKSVEPMAHLAGVPPRTLQEFLSLSEWDHDRLRDTVQSIVARDCSQRQSIIIVDESGHPKKGNKTACVHRDYCGASGKIDNCVMSVHLCYASFDGKFRTMIDSDLYLPKDGWNDPDRRRKAEIPDSVQYHPKYVIAQEQLRRAIDNAVPIGWVTADEWYGEKPAFIESLESMGLRFVLEIPKNLMGWLYEPDKATASRGEVRNLVRWSGPMRRQPWIKFHIKDTGMGAMVWEARAAPFWMKRGGRVVGPYWLVAARDALDRDTIKYFLSNAPSGTPLEVILHVGFSRWPIERTLEDEKSELGLSHFEVRKYPAVLRHLRLTQVSHLFLARQTKRLAEKKSAGDHLPSARRGQHADRHPDAEQRRRPACATIAKSADHSPDAARQRSLKGIPCKASSTAITDHRHSRGAPTLLHPAITAVAL
jgi:SRSO17 transposase